MIRKTIFCFMAFIGTTMFTEAQHKKRMATIVETSASGNKLQPVSQTKPAAGAVKIVLKPSEQYQKIVGFGGSFTAASAYLLNKLSHANRDKILKAYFGKEGAHYSLTRTHINSCDFSLHNYAYANVPGDTTLAHFTIDEDRSGLIPMIKAAKGFSDEGFKIIASPWTAPPWMKDNNDWRGGKLLPHYRQTWALYFSKYIHAYKNEGINIWGVTVENEPLGNDHNWESMHFTPGEMSAFVREFLGPQFEKDGLDNIAILGYDQNRGEELEKWADAMFTDKETARYFDGTAVHWYASTYDCFDKSLQYTHKLSPTKYLINTEACVDAEVPKWKDDKWYWSKEATDWGWDWAPADQKYLHPKYVPVFRYANDIIGCLNNYVNGWIDWNMVLNKQGGPNWFKNWCTAPVIVDEEKDEVYITPLYYAMAHFSKYIRPNAVRIGFSNADKDLMVTAAQNVDGSIAVVIFNPAEKAKPIRLALNGGEYAFQVSSSALQTVLIK